MKKSTNGVLGERSPSHRGAGACFFVPASDASRRKHVYAAGFGSARSFPGCSGHLRFDEARAKQLQQVMSGADQLPFRLNLLKSA